MTQDITALPESEIDLARASEENRLRLIDPQFADEVTVVGDRWGIDSARLFFKESNSLILAEETDAAALRAATLSVSQRVPMVTYDDSIRPQISQLLNDLDVDRILVIGNVPWASQSGQLEVIHDPGNTKALGEYTAFRFDSKVVMNRERMVDNIARLDSSTKTELKAAWEPLPQHLTKEKMPAIPAQARRDAQMAPVIVATKDSPLANVVNATAYGGTVFVMEDPDPTATKAGAAITAGLSDGPIVALGPEFGSVTEFTHKITQGWKE
ncbi:MULTISPECIES: hypothetical protein [Corynebacterium]|uniref:hypothetical protein n=1 Tax=Corynebacterium TaxID=1716 RepID=UPI001FEF2785|nr:hypothetical protein [Corynebacterium sp. HMSC072D12]